MTANELRVGNLVYHPLTKENLRIKQNDLCDFANGFIFIDAITLTKEWLLKFGFEKGSDKWMVKNDMAIFLDKRFKTNLILQDSEENNWCSFNIKVLYIHQLQNLYFALVGEELTFKSK